MDDSPLSRLPAELTNRIYEMALTFDSPLLLNEIRKANGITCACRQARSETRLIFWASNSFKYDYPDPLERIDFSTPAHTEQVYDMQVYYMLKYTLGAEVLKYGQGMEFTGTSATTVRTIMSIYSGEHALGKNPWSHKWQNMQRTRLSAFPTGYRLVPLEPFFGDVLKAYEELGFEIFALRENERFSITLAMRRFDDLQKFKEDCRKGKRYEFCALLPEAKDGFYENDQECNGASSKQGDDQQKAA